MNHVFKHVIIVGDRHYLAKRIEAGVLVNDADGAIAARPVKLDGLVTAFECVWAMPWPQNEPPPSGKTSVGCYMYRNDSPIIDRVDVFHACIVESVTP